MCSFACSAVIFPQQSSRLISISSFFLDETGQKQSPLFPDVLLSHDLKVFAAVFFFSLLFVIFFREAVTD